MAALVIEFNTSASLTETLNTLVVSTADRTRLARAIELLLHRERLVLALFYVEELSVIKVASVLDMEIRHVLLCRAGTMTLLRDSLAQS